MSKSEVMWAVIETCGDEYEILPHTLSFNLPHAEALAVAHELVDGDNLCTWKDLQQLGYRSVEVRVEVIEDD